jgi:hypothetical protein
LTIKIYFKKVYFYFSPLQTVMADVSKPEDFVTQYMRILPDSDSAELQIVQLYRTKMEGQGTYI